MKFSDGQLEQLTNALYDDAVNSGDNWSTAFQDYRRQTGISFEKFKDQMMKHPSLIEKLSIK